MHWLAAPGSVRAYVVCLCVCVCVPVCLCVRVCVSGLGKHQKPLILRFLMGNTSTGGARNLVGPKCKAPKVYGRLQMGPLGSHGSTVHSSQPQTITHGWGTIGGVPAPPDSAPIALSVFTGRGWA